MNSTNDVALPPLSAIDAEPSAHGTYEVYEAEYVKEYAREAVLADRQQRGGDVDERAEYRSFQEWALPRHDRLVITSPLGAAHAGWQARAALAAQPAASAEPVGHDGLLPCPFCGRSAHLSRSDELVNVRCDGWNPGECLGAGPNCYTEAEARIGWNRRAALAAHKPDGGDAKDAERWRWLRGHFRFAADSDCEIWFDSSLKHSPADQLDAAIDAAMAQQRQGEGGE